jgi:hypothetical protein
MICPFVVFRFAIVLSVLRFTISSNNSYIHAISCNTHSWYFSYVTVIYKLYCYIYRSWKLRCYCFNECHYCHGSSEEWCNYLNFYYFALYNTRYLGLWCTCTFKPAQVVTSVQQSPFYKVTIFLACNKNIHVTWFYAKRSHVFNEHYLFVPKVTSYLVNQCNT